MVAERSVCKNINWKIYKCIRSDNTGMSNINNIKLVIKYYRRKFKVFNI